MNMAQITFVTHDRRHVHVIRENDRIRLTFPPCDDRAPKEFSMTSSRHYDEQLMRQLASFAAVRCEADPHLTFEVVEQYYDVMKSLLNAPLVETDEQKLTRLQQLIVDTKIELKEKGITDEQIERLLK